MHQPQRAIDGVRRQASARAAPEARLHPLRAHDPEADAGVDARDDEARRVGAEVHEREELGHGPESLQPGGGSQ